MNQLSISGGAKTVVALGGLVLLGILAVLIAVLFSLEGTRSEIKTTRATLSQTEERVERLTTGIGPLLSATSPLADPEVRRDARRAAGAVAVAAELVPDLAEDAARGVAAALGIADEFRGARLAQTLEAGRSFAAVATPALADVAPRLAYLLAGLDVGPGPLRSCLSRLRTRAPSEPGQVACLLRVVPTLRGQLARVRRTLRHSLSTQRATRDRTAETVTLFRESLAIQREILVHVRSLDAKTGGTVPPVATSP